MHGVHWPQTLDFGEIASVLSHPWYKYSMQVWVIIPSGGAVRVSRAILFANAATRYRGRWLQKNLTQYLWFVNSKNFEPLRANHDYATNCYMWWYCRENYWTCIRVHTLKGERCQEDRRISSCIWHGIEMVPKDHKVSCRNLGSPYDIRKNWQGMVRKHKPL